MPDSLISLPPMMSIAIGTSCADSLFLRAVVVMVMLGRAASIEFVFWACATEGSANIHKLAQLPNAAWTNSAPPERGQVGLRRGRLLDNIEIS